MNPTGAAETNSINATLGSITISQPNAAALVVDMDTNSSINATAAGQDITFNGTGITMNNAGGGLINANDLVALNGAGGAVSVNVDRINGSITGTGTSVSVTTDNAAGNLNVGTAAGGTLTSTAGNLTLASANNITYQGDATATGGNLTSTSGVTGITTVNNNADVSASGSTTINTPTLTLVDASTVNAGTGNVNIQSNAVGFGLTVNMNGAGDNSKIVSTGANVTFNNANAGQITLNNGGGTGNTGLIAADGGTANSGNGVITFNGGTNAVNADFNTARGCIGGSGDPFNVQANTGTADGNANTVGFGNITSNQDISLQGPNVWLCGPITANGAGSDITVTSTDTTSGMITQEVGAPLLANANINFNTTSLNLNSTSTATNGVINVQGNTAVTNAVTVNFLQPGAASALIATNGGAGVTNNINFNPTTAGQITVTGGVGNANGLINAGAGENVTYNGNGATNNDVTVNINQITGNNTGDGNVVAITTLAGLTVGPFTSTGNAAFTATGVGSNVSTSGDITSAGTLTLDAGSGDADVVINNGNKIQGTAVTLVSGTGVGSEVRLGNGSAAVTATTGDVTITTPVLNMTAGANSVSATLGDVLVQSNGAGNALAVNLGAGSQINAATVGTGDIFFNPDRSRQYQC
jgi:hypothetical protein